jgi:hypothetical protein
MATIEDAQLRALCNCPKDQENEDEWISVIGNATHEHIHTCYYQIQPQLAAVPQSQTFITRPT